MRRMLRVTGIVLAAACGLATTGVGEAAEPQKSSDVTLKVASWKETMQLLPKYKGRVVILDLWSTSCIPCMREFPNLVQLQERFGDKVACISFNCDYVGIKSKPPEYYRERVMKFLQKREATFLNVLSSTPSDELFDQIQLASIPAVYVFGPDGKLVNRFDNDEGKYGDEFTYKEHVIPLVERLLAR